MVVILEGQSKIAPWQEENGVYGLMVSIKLTIIISINYNMIFLIALWISIANIYFISLFHIRFYFCFSLTMQETQFHHSCLL